MSCSQERDRQAAILEEGSFIAASGVVGADTCIRDDCNAPLLSDRLTCGSGHAQSRQVALDLALKSVQAWYNEAGQPEIQAIEEALGQAFPQEVFARTKSEEGLVRALGLAEQWFEEAPIEEVEAAEASAKQNFPIVAIGEARDFASGTKGMGLACPLQVALLSLTGHIYDVDRATVPRAAELGADVFVLRPGTPRFWTRRALDRLGVRSMKADGERRVWYLPVNGVGRELDRLERMVGVQGGLRDLPRFSVQVPVPDDLQDQAGALMRGQNKVTGVEVTALAGEQVCIEVRNAKGDLATGNMIVPVGVAVEWAQRFLEKVPEQPGEDPIEFDIEIPVPKDIVEAEESWSYLKNGVVKATALCVFHKGDGGQAVIRVKNTRGAYTAGYITIPTSVMRETALQIVAAAQGTLAEVGLGGKRRQVQEEVRLEHHRQDAVQAAKVVVDNSPAGMAANADEEALGPQTRSLAFNLDYGRPYVIHSDSRPGYEGRVYVTLQVGTETVTHQISPDGQESVRSSCDYSSDSDAEWGVAETLDEVLDNPHQSVHCYHCGAMLPEGNRWSCPACEGAAPPFDWEHSGWGQA